SSKEAMEKARDCLACGECVERCPYKLSIPEVIRGNLALYEQRLAEHSAAQ
ncbi:MAG: aldo/keto reductase, partial [Chloroflexi bacterium]|nr:aldo/keto reductase [Chloroflexota bacterium]